MQEAPKSPNPMHIITLHRWEKDSRSFVAEFSPPNWRWLTLWSSSLDGAVRQAAQEAGLDEEFRDARGEEWDILLPDQTRFQELPDGQIGDYEVDRRRRDQLSQDYREPDEPDDPNFHWEWKGDHGVATVKLPPRCANLPWERKAIIFERWRARYWPKCDKHWELKGDHAVLTMRPPARQTNQPQPWERKASNGNS